MNNKNKIKLPRKFVISAKNKFESGKLEHGNNWREVDHSKELLEECLDGFNYAQGAKDYNDVTECLEIQALFFSAWKLARKLKSNKC